MWGHQQAWMAWPLSPTVNICQERGPKEEATLFPTLLREQWEGRLGEEVVGKPGVPSKHLHCYLEVVEGPSRAGLFHHEILVPRSKPAHRGSASCLA